MTFIVTLSMISVTMKTLRYLSCPVCDYSMSQDALSKRKVGRFRADVRLCQGRKGLPHVAYDDLTASEKDIVRRRLLMAVQAALDEGIIAYEDLTYRAPRSEASREQLPMPMVVASSEALAAL